jgi:hypothetical protein
MALENKKSIPSTLRNCVWNTYIGPALKEGRCFCCFSEIISCANFECGHVQAKTKAGETNLQNLRPVCSLCNKSMGNQNMEDFIKQYGFTKSKNWNGINNTIKYQSQNYNLQNNIKEPEFPKSNEIEKNKCLDILTLKQLQQICKIFFIPHTGTKPKLMKRIFEKNITSENIIEKVDTQKSYLVFCDGFEIPLTCKNSIISELSHACDLCCTNKNGKKHIYYTDNRIEKDKFLINKTVICEICKKISTMEQFENALLNSKFKDNIIQVKQNYEKELLEKALMEKKIEQEKSNQNQYNNNYSNQTNKNQNNNNRNYQNQKYENYHNNSNYRNQKSSDGDRVSFTQLKSELEILKDKDKNRTEEILKLKIENKHFESQIENLKNKEKHQSEEILKLKIENKHLETKLLNPANENEEILKLKMENKTLQSELDIQNKKLLIIINEKETLENNQKIQNEEFSNLYRQIKNYKMKYKK